MPQYKVICSLRRDLFSSLEEKVMMKGYKYVKKKL